MAESNYIKAIRVYTETLRNALAICEDGFKAPEQMVETSPDVVRAAWNMQVEYAALIRGSGE